MKFKVGDRVAVYDSRLVDNRQVGVITSLTDPNGFYGDKVILVEEVERNDEWPGDEIIVSPKQCRKLKKKETKYYWLGRDGYTHDRFKAFNLDEGGNYVQGKVTQVGNTECSNWEWIKVKVVK